MEKNSSEEQAVRFYLDKAKGLIYEGLLDEAEDNLKKAMEKNPNLSFPYALLGKIRFIQGQYVESEEFLRKSVNLDPELENFRLLLARVLYELEEYGEAQDVLKNLLTSTDKRQVKSGSYEVAAAIYMDQKEFDMAFNEIINSFFLNPTIGKLKSVLLVLRKHSIFSRVILIFLVLPFFLPGRYALPISILGAIYLLLEWVYSMTLRQLKERTLLLILTIVLIFLYAALIWI